MELVGKRSVVRPRVGVGCAVVREGRVLLGQRRGAHGTGDWAFPGGHLEFGETLRECAARELKEEAGLELLAMREGPWTNDLMEGDKHYITLFAFIQQFRGEPQLCEPEKCAGWYWFRWEELPQPLFPSIRSLLAKVGLEGVRELADSTENFTDGGAPEERRKTQKRLGR